MGIIFAILNCLLLGSANVLLKKGFKDFPPSIAFFIFSVFSILLWAPLGLLLGVQFQQFLLGSFVGLMSAVLGQAIYIYVLEKGEVSITATILSSFSIFTILFSMIFNHEKLATETLLFIMLTIVGTLIVSFPEKFNKKDFQQTNIILWGVFAAMCIGASDTLTKYFINISSAGSFLFYVSIAQILVSLVYLKIDKQPIGQFRYIFHRFQEYKFAFLGSLFIAVSTMFLFLAFNYTLASIASPIAASAPVITVILALLFLKEKISPKNWVGLILVLISIIAIGIVNP